MSFANRSARDSYAFGDNDVAAARLKVLAHAFEPATREFLGQFFRKEPRRIVDLGCGPGYTTRLLAELFPQAEVLGLDCSPPFIELANQVRPNNVRFAVADVTQTLPGDGYDLVFCRYLLTHLSEPHSAIALWGGRLRPGGVIAIEENDWIRTDQPAFAKYLAIVEAMLADGGRRLYVGAELNESDRWRPLALQSSEVVPIVVRDRDAARMFSMNLQNWRSHEFVMRHYAIEEVAQLGRELASLAAGATSTNSITFGRRRLVLERTDAGNSS